MFFIYLQAFCARYGESSTSSCSETVNIATCQDSSNQATGAELLEPQQELMEVSIFILLPKYFS